VRIELGWAAWESYTNRLLGLDSTVASGSQAHDPGDGVDRRHHTETDYALMADAKYTEQKSFSLNAKLLSQYVRRAAEAGKSSVLPVRLVDKAGKDVHDFVVVPLQDYVMLLNTYREVERGGK
jgi:hypothetical protein